MNHPLAPTPPVAVKAQQEITLQWRQPDKLADYLCSDATGASGAIVKQLNNPKPRNIYDKHYRVEKVVR